jgi:hypothetical protein
MTYADPSWDLYVANFVKRLRVRHQHGGLLKESWFVSVELFRFPDPETAYEKLLEQLRDGTRNEAYRDDEGHIVEVECLGMNDLDRVQASMSRINETLNGDNSGVDVARVELDASSETGRRVRKRHELSLFVEHARQTNIQRMASVSGIEVPWECLCTHWDGWGKASGPEPRPYKLVVPTEFILKRFNSYWSDFIKTESEVDGWKPQGLYAELEEARYPSLEGMLSRHPRLFSNLVLQGLQPELMGHLVSAPSAVQGRVPAYFLQSLTSIDVSGQLITLEGTCCDL